jgi:purine nucleosidase
MPRKILIDTDPGVDDAMAILCALHSPELELVGLTSVFGNAPGEITAQNALRILELEGCEAIPVVRGADRPLIRMPGTFSGHVHGEDGLGDTHLPAPRSSLRLGSAAEFIVETVMASPGQITLVPIGPLTNLALALRLEPRIVEFVEEVVIMGGSAYAGGNVSPVTEANIANDPHAAQIVFSAGWPLTMLGLDVTHRTVLTAARFDRLIQAHKPATDFLARIVPVYQRFHADVLGMDGAIHLHDPSTIAYLIDPSIYQTRRLPIFVETEGHCAGATVPDPRHFWIDGPEVNVCLGVDASRAIELICERAENRYS